MLTIFDKCFLLAPEFFCLLLNSNSMTHANIIACLVKLTLLLMSDYDSDEMSYFLICSSKFSHCLTF